MERMLFCRVGWMEYYQGNLEEDPIFGGGSYVDRYGYGHEIYNFLPDDEGGLYGFVQVGGEMSIWRLGAKLDENNITGVTVIWCATLTYGLYVVGWYKNATAFWRSQPCPTHLVGKRPLPRSDDYWMFRFIARQSDAVLLPVNERNFEIPRATTSSGGFGQRNIWYADSDGDEPLRERILKYISSKEREISRAKDQTPVRIVTHQPDTEKRHRVEQAAMKAVETYYQEQGDFVGTNYNVYVLNDSRILPIPKSSFSNIIQMEIATPSVLPSISGGW